MCLLFGLEEGVTGVKLEACSPLEGQGTQLLAPRESRFQAEREKLGVMLGGFWCL